MGQRDTMGIIGRDYRWAGATQRHKITTITVPKRHKACGGGGQNVTITHSGERVGVILLRVQFFNFFCLTLLPHFREICNSEE